MIHTETRDVKSRGHPPVKSRGSEWTPLLSKLLMEPRCSWIQSYSQTGATVYA